MTAAGASPSSASEINISALSPYTGDTFCQGVCRVPLGVLFIILKPCCVSLFVAVLQNVFYGFSNARGAKLQFKQ